nr:ABC transporter C-terminal domain-containing protein [Sulfurimonas sp.]
KHIEESHQQYSEYLELEKELKELDEMELAASMKEEKVEVREKQKTLKLTFKEKFALEKLPLEIEDLELQMQEKNKCLANPKCYEDIGISQLAKELQEIEEIYEQKVEELLTIQEKEEAILSL